MYIQVMMFSESVTEQHENMLQPTIDLRNECFIDNHDEKKNADNDLCCDDDNIIDDDDNNAGITIYVRIQQTLTIQLCICR